MDFYEGVSSDGKNKTSAVLARFMGSSSEYELDSLPKDDREDACESVLRQLLFPEIAKTVGVPAASSIDELVLKLEVAGPS